MSVDDDYKGEITNKLNQLSNQNWTFDQYLQQCYEPRIKDYIQTICKTYNEEKKHHNNQYYEDLLRQLGYKGELPSNYYCFGTNIKQCFDYEKDVPFQDALDFYQLKYDDSFDYSNTHLWSKWSTIGRQQKYKK